jgi:hypothetical protein
VPWLAGPAPHRVVRVVEGSGPAATDRASLGAFFWLANQSLNLFETSEAVLHTCRGRASQQSLKQPCWTAYHIIGPLQVEAARRELDILRVHSLIVVSKSDPEVGRLRACFDWVHVKAVGRFSGFMKNLLFDLRWSALYETAVTCAHCALHASAPC